MSILEFVPKHQKEAISIQCSIDSYVLNVLYEKFEDKPDHYINTYVLKEEKRDEKWDSWIESELFVQDKQNFITYYAELDQDLGHSIYLEGKHCKIEIHFRE